MSQEEIVAAEPVTEESEPITMPEGSETETADTGVVTETDTVMVIGAAPSDFVVHCGHDPFSEDTRKPGYYSEDDHATGHDASQQPTEQADPVITASCEEVKRFLELRSILNSSQDLHIDEDDSDDLRAKKLAAFNAYVQTKRDALEQLRGISVKVAVAEAREAAKHMQKTLDGTAVDPFTFVNNLEFVRVDSVPEDQVAMHDKELLEAERVASYGEKEVADVQGRINALDASRTDTKAIEARIAELQQEKKRLIISGKDNGAVVAEIKELSAKSKNAADDNAQIAETVSILKEHVAALEARNQKIKSILGHMTRVNESLHAFIFAGSINSASMAVQKALHGFTEIIDRNKDVMDVRFPHSVAPTRIFTLPLLEGYEFCVSEHGHLVSDPDIEKRKYLCQERV